MRCTTVFTKALLLLAALSAPATMTALPIVEVVRRSTCAFGSEYVQNENGCRLIVPGVGEFSANTTNLGLPLNVEEGTRFSEFGGGISGGSNVLFYGPPRPFPQDTLVIANAFMFLRYHFITEGPRRVGVRRLVADARAEPPASVELSIAPEAAAPQNTIILGVPFTITFRLNAGTVQNQINSGFASISTFQLFEADGVTPVAFIGAPVPEPSAFLPLGLLITATVTLGLKRQKSKASKERV